MIANVTAAKSQVISSCKKSFLAPNEVRILEKAFRTYRRRTCIRFRPHTNEKDYLHIVKGLG